MRSASAIRPAALALALLAATPSQIAWAQSTGVAPGEQQRGGRLTKPPALTNFKEVEAAYPEEERASGKSVAVVLQLAISEKGDVTEVVVVGPAGPAFDKAAAESARKFKFTPAEIDGKAAPVKLTFRYDFAFHDEIVDLGPQVNFSGEVLDATSRKRRRPLANITLRVSKDGAPVAETTTDEDGYFELEDIAPGTYTVEVSGAGIATVRTEETIEPAKALEVKYKVEP
jgi:TonB family protein